jgi:hypothetical protein
MKPTDSLQLAAPLLLKMCELSVEVFDRILPELDGDARQHLHALANTMRKTIAMAKGEPVKAMINEGDCV